MENQQYTLEEAVIQWEKMKNEVADLEAQAKSVEKYAIPSSIKLADYPAHKAKYEASQNIRIELSNKASSRSRDIFDFISQHITKHLPVYEITFEVALPDGRKAFIRKFVSNDTNFCNIKLDGLDSKIKI